MNESKKQASQDLENSINDSSQFYKSAGKGSKILMNKLSKLAIRSSTEVGGKVSTSVFSFLFSDPIRWIILVLILVILICIFVPVALANSKDENGESIYESESSYQNLMTRAIQATSSAIEGSYKKTQSEMEQKVIEFIDSNYPGNEKYIHVTYMMDDLDTTASNITGYIQAVNGVLINWLPTGSNKSHASGLDNNNGLSVGTENEFNSLGDEYKKCIQEYAESEPLFSINLTSDIKETTINELITDGNGNPIMDADGNEQYQKKTVYAGDIYVDVTYDISDYKEQDIEQASSIYYEQIKDSTSSKDICKTQIKEAISEILYVLTGYKTIPSAHTYQNNDWDLISGSNSESGTTIFDGVTSDGWTVPVKNATRSAGTWNYEGGGKHLGYDFASSEGSEIIAVANGVVLVSADGCAYGGLGSTCAGKGGSTSGGNQIYLLVTVQNKLYTVKYLHMKLGTPIAQGTQVKAGDFIGQVGSTGNSNGAHCHVEIFYLGDASDFQNYLDTWNGDLTFGCGWAGSYDGYGRRCDAGYEAPCRIRPESIFGE